MLLLEILHSTGEEAALHIRTCSPRRKAVQQQSGLTEVCSTRDQADRRGSRCRSRVERVPITNDTTNDWRTGRVTEHRVDRSVEVYADF